MRILLTTDAVGGVWDYTVTLARRLCGGGNEVMVAVVGSPSPAQLARLPRGAAVEILDVRLEWMLDSERDVVTTSEWLRTLAERWRADIVHLNQMAYTGFGTFAAPTVVVVHSDVHSWFTEVRRSAPPPEWTTYGAMVRRGIARASVVVTPSSYQGELTRRLFGRAPDAVIHNGVEPPTSPLPDRRERVLITAGRAWDEAKGFESLDLALSEFGDAAPEVLHFGALVSHAGLSFRPRRLACQGPASPASLHQRMRHALAYVAPSLYEPFGLAPLEAAYRGCALLLADIPTFREIWDGCADFFTPGDPSAIVEGIGRILAEPERTSRQARRARTRAGSRFTAERMTEEYLTLYERLSMKPRSVGRWSKSPLERVGAAPERGI